MSNKHIEKLAKLIKTGKTITQKQNAAFIDTFRGQSGGTIKSRKGGEYNYTIKFNYQNYSKNGLGGDHPSISIWDMLARYPDDLLQGIYNRFGVDLVGGSEKEIVKFLYDTGLIEITGNPNEYAYYKLKVLIMSMMNYFEGAQLKK